MDSYNLTVDLDLSHTLYFLWIIQFKVGKPMDSNLEVSISVHCKLMEQEPQFLLGHQHGDGYYNMYNLQSSFNLLPDNTA